MKKIGILGGSFDPVHQGHLVVAKQVRQQLGLNEIWFMPTAQAPLKTDHSASYGDRVAMLKLALKPYRYFKVSELEAKLPAPSFTINTVNALQKSYPATEFYWIIGDDQVEQLAGWHQIELLLTMIKFVVVNRYQSSLPSEFLTVSIPAHPASSTTIRHGDFTYLPASVNQYINERVLYYETIIQNYLSPTRYQHSLAVAEFAGKLAVRYGVSVERARLAALLHDVAKELDPAELKRYMIYYCPAKLDQSPKTWHSYVGAVLAKQEFNIRDTAILQAIKHHTDGASSQLLSEIIYCADKVESTRPYPVSKLQELCLADIKAAKQIIQALAFAKIKENSE